MIISDTLLWIVGIIVFAAVMYLVVRKKQWSYALFRKGLGFGILAAFAIVFLIVLPSKRIVLIEDYKQANPPYDHTLINAYGNPTIQLFDGDSFETKGLDLKMGKKYVFNCSHRGMLLYPVAYTNTSGFSSSFKKGDNYKAPDPIYIQRGCYDEITSMPDFWFENPPESIESSEGLIESIWNSIFGKVEEKWCIIPYTPQEEIDAIQNAVDAITNKE